MRFLGCKSRRITSRTVVRRIVFALRRLVGDGRHEKTSYFVNLITGKWCIGGHQEMTSGGGDERSDDSD